MNAAPRTSLKLMLSSQLVVAPLKVAKIKYTRVKGKHVLRFFVLNTRLNRNIFTDPQRRLKKSLCSCKREKMFILLARLSLKQWDSVQWSLKKHSFHSCDFRKPHTWLYSRFITGKAFIFYAAEPNGRWLAPKGEGDLTQVTARLLS